MIHKPIQIKNLDLSFPYKTCFENFNCRIAYGNRIAIIGRNGSGKTTLLKIIAGICEPTSGDIYIGDDTVIGYVPQIIENYVDLSGGQRLNAAITEALSLEPNVLLLDEPTNHLDIYNRKSLMRMLKLYSGTLIIVSHDVELLRNCIDTLWHIDNGKIHIFSGNYNDYIGEIKLKRASIEDDIARLNRQKKDMHNKLMQEQQRIAKSKASGEKKVANRKWLKMVGDLKGMKAEKSRGKKLKTIDETKNGLINKLSELRLPEVIVPKFSIDNYESGEHRILVQIFNGTVGYSLEQPLLSDISLTIAAKEHVAIAGDNGSGKSTLVKAILGDGSVYKNGDWYVVKQDDIGYLDQHYSNLDPNKTVFEMISELVPRWSYAEVRSHLNDFLFRKNEEVNNKVSALSGGEKARLSLAKIAANPPKLLILDEITNNLDLETKDHMAQVLKDYPGAIIIVSHDVGFLEEIGIDEEVNVGSFKFSK